MKKNKYFFCILFLILLFPVNQSRAQAELVPPSDKIYNFLDRMLTEGIIQNYSSSMVPISRREIGKLLAEINNRKTKLTRTDKYFLEDYLIEYSYDINRSLKKSSSFFSNLKFKDIFGNKKQKYLYASADSSASFFWDAIGEIKYIGANGDSLGKPHLLLGQLGTRRCV